MSSEILRRIQEAEEQADLIHQEAARDARDIVKGVETAISAQARDAQKELRDKVLTVLADARAATEDEIRTLEVRRAAEREELRRAAKERVKAACDAIFERIVG
jgi:vacuolar-type H+-ATPase subunit H